MKLTLEKITELLKYGPVKCVCNDGWFIGSFREITINQVWGHHFLITNADGEAIASQQTDIFEHFSLKDRASVDIVVPNIYREIKDLREAQREKWGNDNNHTVMEFVSIIAEEFGKVAKKSNHFHYNQDESRECGDVRKELVSLAAVTVAMIEYIDNKQE